MQHSVDVIQQIDGRESGFKIITYFGIVDVAKIPFGFFFGHKTQPQIFGYLIYNFRVEVGDTIFLTAKVKLEIISKIKSSRVACSVEFFFKSRKKKVLPITHTLPGLNQANIFQFLHFRFKSQN